MEILCTCDGRYLPHAATMLCSLLDHNSVSRIHLFYGSITSRELAKLKFLLARYGTPVTFYEMIPGDFEDLRIDKYASVAVYYRILAPRLLPADIGKILYLDSDLIVRRSLNDLWQTELTNQALAAVPDYGDAARKALGLPAGAKYFNSGVLLINLKFWRENRVPERAIEFVRNNPEKVQYWDQDALNAILVQQWIELPEYWNTQSETVNDWLRASESGAEMDPAVVHFTTSLKPWQYAGNSPFKREYHRYRLKTPWRRYKLEGSPSLRQRVRQTLRKFARLVLPRPFRQWVRSRITCFQA
jgi:lipopolysaccharide biosynthesis glycosyltransferase